MHQSPDFITAPLPSLIRKIALPSSVGLIFNTFFNVVDTYYGGMISTTALAALSLSFPVFFIVLSVGMGMGTGSTALISQALGAREEKKALQYGFQAITFSVINAVGLTLIGLLLAPALFRILGAADEYLAIALEYMNVILAGTLFFLTNSALNALLTSRGDTRTYRNFLIAGFFLNVAFDPWFMFGGLGLPAFGIRGVAISTVLIQAMGTIYLVIRIKNRGLFREAKLSDFRPNSRIFGELFAQGFPASLNMLSVAIGIFVITFFAGKFGKEAVAAYGIATRIEQIALLPTIGLNIAALTIAGQNMGAGFPERVLQSWKLNLRYGLTIMSVGVTGVFLFAEPLLAFFTSDPKVVAIGTEYLRIAVFFFFAYIFLNISVSTLQGMKKPYYAIFIGSYRQFLLPYPLFLLLAISLNMGTKGIWWGIFIANWSAAIFTFFYTRRKIVNLLKQDHVKKEQK